MADAQSQPAPCTSAGRRHRTHSSRIRRFARMLMHRGEVATKDGDFAGGAVQFERAAWSYEYVGDPLAAAEATLELGRCLLYLHHGKLLPGLAGRIENLAREESKALPVGGLLTMRVWAVILRRGEKEPCPLLQLIQTRRRLRQIPNPEKPH